MSIIPNIRPQATRAEVESWFPAGTFKKGGIYIIASRGHFLKTIGNPKTNDRKKYDDAIFVLTDMEFAGFNANVDPADSSNELGAPVIQPGIYASYTFDFHKKQYWAICHRTGAVTIKRDLTGDKLYHCRNCGLNLHEGGINDVHSEGCMTMPPPQFGEMLLLAIKEAMRIHGAKRWHKATITLCVRENKAA